METGKTDKITIIERLAKLDGKVDSINNAIIESNKSIAKLTDAIMDLRVIQSRVSEQDKKINILFNKLDELHNRLDKFTQRITFSVIGGGITVAAAIIINFIK